MKIILLTFLTVLNSAYSLDTQEQPNHTSIQKTKKALKKSTPYIICALILAYPCVIGIQCYIKNNDKTQNTTTPTLDTLDPSIKTSKIASLEHSLTSIPEIRISITSAVDTLEHSKQLEDIRSANHTQAVDTLETSTTPNTQTNPENSNENTHVSNSPKSTSTSPVSVQRTVTPAKTPNRFINSRAFSSPRSVLDLTQFIPQGIDYTNIQQIQTLPQDNANPNT